MTQKAATATPILAGWIQPAFMPEAPADRLRARGAEDFAAARAECVMLNKGPNLGAAITALDGLLRRMAEHQSKKTSRLRALHSW